jgi:hypothetical protein
MITDALLQLESAQVLVRAAGTYVSTNTIDLSVNRDIGSGEPRRCCGTSKSPTLGGTSISSSKSSRRTPTSRRRSWWTTAMVMPLANLVLGGDVVRFVPELLGGPAGVTAPVTGAAGIGSRACATTAPRRSQPGHLHHRPALHADRERHHGREALPLGLVDPLRECRLGPLGLPAGGPIPRGLLGGPPVIGPQRRMPMATERPRWRVNEQSSSATRW